MALQFNSASPEVGRCAKTVSSARGFLTIESLPAPPSFTSPPTSSLPINFQSSLFKPLSLLSYSLLLSLLSYSLFPAMSRRVTRSMTKPRAIITTPPPSPATLPPLPSLPSPATPPPPPAYASLFSDSDDVAVHTILPGEYPSHYHCHSADMSCYPHCQHIPHSPTYSPTSEPDEGDSDSDYVPSSPWESAADYFAQEAVMIDLTGDDMVIDLTFE